MVLHETYNSYSNFKNHWYYSKQSTLQSYHQTFRVLFWAQKTLHWQHVIGKETWNIAQKVNLKYRPGKACTNFLNFAVIYFHNCHVSRSEWLKNFKHTSICVTLPCMIWIFLSHVLIKHRSTYYCVPFFVVEFLLIKFYMWENTLLLRLETGPRNQKPSVWSLTGFPVDILWGELWVNYLREVQGHSQATLHSSILKPKHWHRL